MLLLGLIEFVVSAVILVVMTTQVIIPIWQGTILFPFFRSKAKELERQRAAVRDEIISAGVEEEIEQLNELAKTKRRKKESA